MRRPASVTIATIVLVLLSLTDFPFPWEQLFPGAEEAPDFIVYAGIVLGVAGLVVAIGFWMLKRWGYWATLVVAVLNFLLAAPGVFEAPGAALRAAIAVTAVVALLLIVLVLLPTSRRAFRPAQGS
jgi:multisubunit Na+/H+ antiporter MnhB subunit